MRRWALLTAAVSLLALAPAGAQMRGGVHGASGPMRGVGSLHIAPGASRHAFTAPRSQPWGFSHPASHQNCLGCFHHHMHHGHYPWWTRAYRYPFYGYGLGYSYYSPSLWDSGSSYAQTDPSYESERYLTRQIDELSQEVQRLRQEQEDRAYDEAQRRSPQPAETQPGPPEAARKSTDSRPDLPTILVFRDQHIQEVQNYAIVGKDLVVVADRRSTKIPLERLDLVATAKLNDERGVDFRVPR